MMTMTEQTCARLAGGSARNCGCKLPNLGGWLDCPPVARGLLRAVRAAHGEQSPTGEFCSECGGMMVRTGTCMTCQLCGTSSGGCS
jgi:hypothetical protein